MSWVSLLSFLSCCFRYFIVTSRFGPNNPLFTHLRVLHLSSDCLAPAILMYSLRGFFLCHILSRTHVLAVLVSALAIFLSLPLLTIKSCSIFFNLHIKYLFISPASAFFQFQPQFISSILKWFSFAFVDLPIDQTKNGKFSYWRAFVSVWRACVVRSPLISVAVLSLLHFFFFSWFEFYFLFSCICVYSIYVSSFMLVQHFTYIKKEHNWSDWMNKKKSTKKRLGFFFLYRHAIVVQCVNN